MLGVNIDHVATLRQARLSGIPDICAAAREAVLGGADQITIHLREDRRHIQDADLPALQKRLKVPINLEMALDSGITGTALKRRPEKVCIVPEKRRELTTEGGLDVLSNSLKLKTVIPKLKSKGIKVSLFIDPIEEHIRRAALLGADAVEIHTGTYAESAKKKRMKELERIRRAAALARSLSLSVHAGHGLDYENVRAVCAIPEIEELNIGYAIVCRAITTGLRQAVREMADVMAESKRRT